MTTHTWGTAGTISGLANNQQGNTISQNLATMVQGGSPPTTTTTGFTSLSGVWWHDTTNNQIKVRDQADTAWILIGSVDETNKLFTAAASGIAAIQGACKTRWTGQRPPSKHWMSLNRSGRRSPSRWPS